MAENEQTKVCPLCAETIKAAAKVCPYCRKIQKKWVFITQYDLLALVTALLFAGIAIMLISVFADGRSFSSSRDKISILSSQITVEATHDHTNVVVSGILTNASDYAWELHRFEVRFLDGAGKLVDADSSGSSMTVLSHSDASFHLNLYSRNSIPENTSQKILVNSANEPGIWFPSED